MYGHPLKAESLAPWDADCFVGTVCGQEPCQVDLLWGWQRSPSVLCNRLSDVAIEQLKRGQWDQRTDDLSCMCLLI